MPPTPSPQLREHGVRIAIDDFGAGYCSLSYLQRHPVDMIKIDRAFIDELGRDPLGNTLARTILQMASSLDIRTVAEGIETTGAAPRAAPARLRPRPGLPVVAPAGDRRLGQAVRRDADGRAIA